MNEDDEALICSRLDVAIVITLIIFICFIATR